MFILIFEINFKVEPLFLSPIESVLKMVLLQGKGKGGRVEGGFEPMRASSGDSALTKQDRSDGVLLMRAQHGDVVTADRHAGHDRLQG